MKVINKIFCFLSALVLCVPLLCFNVSAVDSAFDDSLLSSLPDFDSTDFSKFDLDFCEQALKSILTPVTSDEMNEYRKDPFYLPVSVTINGTSYLGVTKRCEQTVFLYALINALKQGSIVTTSPVYYFLHSFSYESSNYLYYAENYIFSNTPFHFSSYDSTHNYIIYGKSCFKDNAVFYPMLSNVGVDYSTSKSGKSFIYSSDSFKYCGLNSINSNITNYQHKSLFCNFDIEGSELFSCDLPFSIGFSSVKPKTLINQIDVNLTPEFTIGMDRCIPDSTFGISEDYWSLEVTNNNDFNIQFKCYVIPATGAVNYVSEWSHDESLKSYSSGIPVLVNTDDFIPVVPEETVWMLEKDQWIYSKETENQEDYLMDTPYLVNKPTSNFFVQAGGTFKQVIKWNQLNLNKNQPYQILVTACECPYDRASDIHISLASDDYSQSFKHIIEESYFIIYDDKFSVTNPLYFDSTDNFGGVIANTGSSQVNTDYWKMNAIEKDGEIVIRNADYSNGWRLNPDGGSDSGTLKEGLFNNLDDISISDVTKLVQDSSNYFSVIATVFKVFPVWIWVLLFAGISGLVVIGIFKMLH